MFYNNINPLLATIGPLEIRYYSFAYIIGAIFTYFVLAKLAEERKLGLTKQDIMDFVAYTLLSVIVFSRAFYAIFYDFSFFISNPLQMFAVWNGGLSFHGGLFGAALAGIWFSRKKKISFWKLADLTVIPVAIALFLGRVGNFINGELYGRITSVPWAVKFKGVDGFRHPSQLYEAMKNLFMFAVLWKLRNRKLKDGVLFSLFIVMYGTLRFFIEFFRQPDEQIGFVLFNLSMGQILCLVMLLIGIPMLVYFNKRKP
ncbi:MAG: prolipoprotein diacylglyceryl transferase [Nanoarchaeota archaeon]